MSLHHSNFSAWNNNTLFIWVTEKKPTFSRLVCFRELVIGWTIWNIYCFCTFLTAAWQFGTWWVESLLQCHSLAADFILISLPLLLPRATLPTGCTWIVCSRGVFNHRRFAMQKIASILPAFYASFPFWWHSERVEKRFFLKELKGLNETQKTKMVAHVHLQCISVVPRPPCSFHNRVCHKKPKVALGLKAPSTHLVRLQILLRSF